MLQYKLRMLKEYNYNYKCCDGATALLELRMLVLYIFAIAHFLCCMHTHTTSL